MLTDYSLKMPKNIQAGEHALEQLKEIISSGVHKIVIFTDKGLLDLGLVNLPIQSLKKQESITRFLLIFQRNQTITKHKQ